MDYDFKAPNGAELQGTLERVPAACAVNFTGPTPEVDFEHAGGSEMFWNDQKTEELVGVNVWIDENGDEWLSHHLIPADAKRLSDTALELFAREFGLGRALVAAEALSERLAAVPPAVRFYARKGVDDAIASLTVLHCDAKHASEVAHANELAAQRFDADAVALEELDPTQSEILDWRYAVGNGDTKRGLADWVQARREDAEPDATASPEPAATIAGLSEAMGGPVATDAEIERTRDRLAATAPKMMFDVFAARDGDSYVDEVEAADQAEAETKARDQLATAWHMTGTLQEAREAGDETEFDAELDGFCVVLRDRSDTLPAEGEATDADRIAAILEIDRTEADNTGSECADFMVRAARAGTKAELAEIIREAGPISCDEDEEPEEA